MHQHIHTHIHNNKYIHTYVDTYMYIQFVSQDTVNASCLNIGAGCYGGDGQDGEHDNRIAEYQHDNGNKVTRLK